MRFVKGLGRAVGRCCSREVICDPFTSFNSRFLSSLPSLFLRPLTLVSFLIFCSLSQGSLATKGQEMRVIFSDTELEERRPLSSSSSSSSSSSPTRGNTFSSRSNASYYTDQGDYHVDVDGDRNLQRFSQNGEPSQPPLSNRFQFMEFPQGDYARPTVVMYLLKDAPPPGKPAWDKPTQHMYATDRAFFENPQSRKTLIAGVLGGTIGLVFPATPATGGILWSIGDKMGIPVGGATSGLLVTEIMLTMSPVFARQLYKRAQIIERCLSGEAQFPPKQEGVHFDNKPHVYPPTALHTALKGVVGANAVLEGAYYWAIVGLAEGAVYQHITFGMGWALAAALAEHYYTVGIRRLDRFFVQYNYSSELINQHRKILTMQAKKALHYLGQYPDFVNAVYDTIQDELQRDDTVNSQHFFALSSLFIRHSLTTRLDNDPSHDPVFHNVDEGDDERERSELRGKYPGSSEQLIDDNIELRKKYETLQREMDNLGLEGVKTQVGDALVDQLKPSTKEKLTEYLSVFLTGASSVSRLFGKQYMFEYILENALSVDPAAANIAAWCLAGAHVTAKTIQNYNLEQNYMKSWLNTFSLSHLVDFPYLRKSVGGVSFFNGLLFAAANAGPSLAKFSEMSVAPSLQVLTIIPSFILDIGYIQTYSKENLDELITAAATTHQATTMAATKRLYPRVQDELIWRRAKCHDWLNDLLEFLETADEETTELFYRKTQLCS